MKAADSLIADFAWTLGERFEAYYNAHYPMLTAPSVEVQNGRKYARIVEVSAGSECVFGFIDRETGEIFKAAGWRGPAKHARGNVFSDENGWEAVTDGRPFIHYLT